MTTNLLSRCSCCVVLLQVFTWFVNTIGPEVCFTALSVGQRQHTQTHLNLVHTNQAHALTSRLVLRRSTCMSTSPRCREATYCN